MSRTVTETFTPKGATRAVEITAVPVNLSPAFNHGGYRAQYAILVGAEKSDVLIRKDVYQPRTAEWIVFRDDTYTVPVSYHPTLRSAITAAAKVHYVAHPIAVVPEVPAEGEWTDEDRTEFIEWAQQHGVRPTDAYVPHFEAEREGKPSTAIAGLAYGPHSLDIANGFARTGGTSDAVMAQDEHGNWWLGFYAPEEAREVAHRLTPTHALVFVVANHTTEKDD